MVTCFSEDTKLKHPYGQKRTVSFVPGFWHSQTPSSFQTKSIQDSNTTKGSEALFSEAMMKEGIVDKP